MNPSSNKAGFELPPPVVEQIPVESQPEVNDRKLQEKTVPAASANKQFSVNQSIPAIPSANPVNIPSTTTDDTSNITTSAIADHDEDIIDKAWVNKAKDIVDKTKDDPYKQSEQLTSLKADYMRKRFNRALKISN